MFKEKLFLPLISIILASCLVSCRSASAAKNSVVPTPLQTIEATPSDSAAIFNTSAFTLSSPEVTEGNSLPVEYTCDGAGTTLPLTWNGAPTGTMSFAVVMHHVASPEDVHWYWILYNIPANINSLEKNNVGIGTPGNNSVNGNLAYAPPCSKGPGEKAYTYTIYALSAQPHFSIPTSLVNRDVLLEAIRNITLASAELHVTYTRK
jgi:phosphatidylethanolamine-binding protein (PEBP) family uncharacterized protein